MCLQSFSDCIEQYIHVIRPSVIVDQATFYLGWLISAYFVTKEKNKGALCSVGRDA